jgi:hypothetical protein
VARNPFVPSCPDNHLFTQVEERLPAPMGGLPVEALYDKRFSQGPAY